MKRKVIVNNHAISRALGLPEDGPEYSEELVDIQIIPNPGGWNYVNRNGLNGANKRDFNGFNNPMYGRKRPENIHNQLPAMWAVASNSNKCAVICEGVNYKSVGDAEKAYGTKSMVRKRLDDPNFPEFYRLRERTRRK